MAQGGVAPATEQATRTEAPRGQEAVSALAFACGLTPPQWVSLLREGARLKAHPLDLALGEGLISPERLVITLSRHLNRPLEATLPAPLLPCAAGEAFARRGYRAADGRRVLAPDGAMAVRIWSEGVEAGVVLATPQALLDVLLAADGARLAKAAAHTLPDLFSARRWAARWQAMGEAARRGLPLAGLALLALALLAPVATLVVPPLLLTPLFAVAALAVLTATLESRMPPRALPPTARAALPRYSVLVPLYREANIAPRLVARLKALLYPRDRLQVLFLTEADDEATARALLAQDLPAGMLVLRLPPGEPRTKPRALNLALPFASGELLVVYDAEDAPEPDQLLRAAGLFRALPRRVACLQGRLGIANWRDGVLAARFALDYAALFDCIKAGMGRSGWPVPLGGTSNHFRRDILERIGGWDAWNVTEDADLGIRLARFGYLVEDLPSTTWEEAPNTFTAWMNQRSRWMKGWMQTLAVHLTSPHVALRQLGRFRMAMIGAMGLSMILGSLLYPLFLGTLVLRLLDERPLGAGPLLLAGADIMVVGALVLAVLVEGVPAVLALGQRHALRLLPLVLLAPLTHLMVSWASWRALRELTQRPYYWHKTTHGMARTDEVLGMLRSRRKAPRG